MMLREKMRTLIFALIASYNAHRKQEWVVAEAEEFQPFDLQALKNSADNKPSQSSSRPEASVATNRLIFAKGVIMTIISGLVKSVAYHPDVSEATAACSASVIDVFEARRRLSSEADGMAKEAEKEQRKRQAVYWLISLALLISLLVGMLCLVQSAPQVTTGTDQLSLAAEGEPSQGEVTFGQALQALSVRR